jgi:hypothetical protein
MLKNAGNNTKPKTINTVGETNSHARRVSLAAIDLPKTEYLLRVDIAGSYI